MRFHEPTSLEAQMPQPIATTQNAPAWVDLASADAAASREFYGSLFGWEIEVNPDPQYGGYGLAKIGRQGCRWDRPQDGPQRADGLEPLHRHG